VKTIGFKNEFIGKKTTTINKVYKMIKAAKASSCSQAKEREAARPSECGGRCLLDEVMMLDWN
jgi:hypothetical protein